jgi:O-antigen/teichoic acid export membrane protein
MIIERIQGARSYLASGGLGPFLVRSVAGTGAIKILSMIASFLVGVQLARGLGVKGYGYYGIALSIVTLAGVPAELGLPPLITREVAAAEARGMLGHLFGVLRWGRRIASRLSALMAFLVVVAALALSQLRPSPLVFALLAGAPIIPFMALAKVNCGALRGLRQIVRAQIASTLWRPAAMALLLLLLVHGVGVELQPWKAVGLNAVTASGAWMIAAIWLSQRLPQREHVEPVKEGRQWISSMIPLALTQAIQTLQAQLSILLIGLLASAAHVGLFRIAMTTAVMLSAPQGIIITVTLPLISRLYAQGDRQRLQTLVTRSAQAQFAAVLLLSLPLFAAPDLILTLVYGKAYAAAADVLRIILVGQLISIGFGLNGSVLNMTHHERRVTRAVAIALVLNAATFAILVPTLGIIGAAVGFVVSMLAWNVLTWLDARRLVGVDTSFLPLRVTPFETD